MPGLHKKGHISVIVENRHAIFPGNLVLMAANSERIMLPIQSLLNPSLPGLNAAADEPASLKTDSHNRFEGSTTAQRTTKVRGDDTRLGRVDESMILPKSKSRGPINFPPFEKLDQHVLKEVSRFHVTPLGHIHREFHHIPYSSSKKDLFEKTGRESIEAFKYEFRVPGREGVFVVMWDYNIGIVRMNPFIKWGQFPKTKSSQLLDKNPGLRDMSPGITGGAVLAQGYWVPYRCAKALFATFCSPIAGALIPLFGPSFPSDCIPLDSSNYGLVTISRSLIADVSRESELSRRYYTGMAMSAKHEGSYDARFEQISYAELDQRRTRSSHYLPQLSRTGRVCEAAAAPQRPLAHTYPLPYHPQNPIPVHNAPADSRHLPPQELSGADPRYLNILRNQRAVAHNSQGWLVHNWVAKRRRLSDCTRNARVSSSTAVEETTRGLPPQDRQPLSKPAADGGSHSAQQTAAMALMMLSGSRQSSEKVHEPQRRR